jgi:hypothetical protein
MMVLYLARKKTCAHLSSVIGEHLIEPVRFWKRPAISFHFLPVILVGLDKKNRKDIKKLDTSLYTQESLWPHTLLELGLCVAPPFAKNGCSRALLFAKDGFYLITCPLDTLKKIWWCFLFTCFV